MTDTPSPGSGWWRASDEKWYPQRWEYTQFTASGEGRSCTSLAYDSALQQLNALGTQGWELVDWTASSGGSSIAYLDYWCNVRCIMKRPSVPQ